MTKDDNNLEIYMESKLISFLRTLIKETILDKDILFLSFDIIIILIIIKAMTYNYNNSREEKRREEKRREEKRENYSQGGAPQIKMDLNKNGFYEDEKESRKTLNLNCKTKNNNDNIRIENNKKNKRKNKVIKNISHIRNNIIFLIFLIIIKLYIQILSYNKNNLIKFHFSNMIIRNFSQLIIPL